MTQGNTTWFKIKIGVCSYRRFLKLCEEWPVDETKRGRDLGAYLRQWVAQVFQEGENTQIAEPETCDQMYKSLARLHSNYYKHKCPRSRETSFSGLSLEEYKLILSTEALEEFNEMNKGMWKKLQQKFAPQNPEDMHKAWARSLSRPRT
ncbi:PREDICTED: ubiquinol-cytochrome-c reductase complex assembly factor 2-like [Elephantulus edwardii]|uniref:ubiquinol-cytochrome-c reductase complex assembly factor 2-like n=1 Tax=Elephantulus edwardii TaxID=28737 RepID=UPI0003F05C42|nr:PREDICTED: ubiquinol-cytochrome-c reductase complex assembly factor 2-like [Elephantulus edwardii]